MERKLKILEIFLRLLPLYFTMFSFFLFKVVDLIFIINDILSYLHLPWLIRYLTVFIYLFYLFLELDQTSYKHTRLHRNLVDILNDKSTLSYFVQFLESKNGLSLIKFWLDLESIRTITSSDSISTATSNRVDSQNSDYIDNKKVKLNRSVSSDGYESFRDFDCVSTSTNSCSESNFDEAEETQVNHLNTSIDETNRAKKETTEIEKMTQSLTDDEKSKICEKTRKKDDDVVVESDIKSKRFQPTNILEDALRIYRKYLVTDSTMYIEMPATILSNLSLALCGNGSDNNCNLENDESRAIFWQAFDEAQKHVIEIIEKEYLIEFLSSSYYSKYTVDVLTSENLSLRDILYSEMALFYFMEFLEQESVQNSKLPYLEFWLAATNFRKHVELDLNPQRDQMQADALVIYEKYFSLQATNSLFPNSNSIRTKVEESICSVEMQSKCFSQCFNLPIRIVEVFMERNFLNKFIKSQLFCKYLTEVMSKITDTDSGSNGVIRRNSSLSLKFPQKRHRRTHSDIVSDNITKAPATRCISTQNTLLAMDSRKKTKSTDLHIDSRHIYNPDLLWRRQSIGLSFGRVDSLGRYERDFDLPSSNSNNSISTSKSAFQLQSAPGDDVDEILEKSKWNSTQNRIKNAVRKLVHLPEDSVQQEIAWQVAEMIIKEVTNITLHNSNCP